MIDVETPRSPGWWLQVLTRQLHDRRTGRLWQRGKTSNRGVRPGLELLRDYYDGEPPLPDCAAGWRDGMVQFLRLSRMNYTELIIGAVLDRMVPVGWRTGVDSDRDGDEVAKRVADVNAFELVLGDAVEFMLSQGDGYMIVGEPRRGSDVPTVTAEDPQQVITAHDAATGATLAALKLYRDEWTGTDVAHVFTPGRVHVARTGGRLALSGSERFAATGWDWDEAGVDGRLLPDGLRDRVAVARLRNRRGVAEHEPHLDVLDRINDGIFERVTIAKMQAFRQRALLDAPNTYGEDHEKAGQEIDYTDAFSSDPGSLWLMPPGSKIWESQAIDLGPVRLAIKDDVEAVAAVTRTPLHYVTPDAASGSAEGASTMREGHVFRVEDRRRRADAGLAEVMSMVFAAMGDGERSRVEAIKTIWAPVERYSMSERWQAAAAAKGAGLPQSSVFTDVAGYMPADLVRLERERGDDLLFAPVPPAGG